MKKTNIFKVVLLMITLALSGAVRAQSSRNLHIGNQNNQTATNIRVCPDGTGTIIAGYDYDINTGGDVANAQMVLMKIDPAGTNILWQEKFGVPGANNLIYNMILTHDDEIVIVGTMGRSAVYNDNIASIMKLDHLTGAILWQNNMRDAAHTPGGEIFYGVTELGAAGNYALVAVGSWDSQPTVVNSLICEFRNSDGQLIYNEVYNIDNNSSDSYYGICTDPTDGVTTYIVGSYNGDTYQSGQAHMYRPGMFAPGPYVAGTFFWDDYFDFSLPGLTVTYVNGKPVVTSGGLSLQDNFFVDVYYDAGKLVIYGGSLHNYTTTGGAGQSVTRLDAATGGVPENWQIQSSNMAYANVSKIYMINNDHIINMQTPGTSWYDPIRWLTTTAVNSDVVLTDIPSLSASSITTTPVRYVSGSGSSSLRALIDITSDGSDLYMTGVTNDSYYGYGKNDIYYVQTPMSIPLDTHGTICDSVDTTGQLWVPMTPYYHTQALTHFTPDTVMVDTIHLDYAIDTMCGKKLPVKHLCSNATWNDPMTTLTAVITPADTAACTYTVTAVGTPNAPWHMFGYFWNTTGWDYTSGTSSQIVVVPYGGAVSITVTYWAVDAAGDTCYTTRNLNLNCQKPPCYDTACTKLTIVNGSGTGVGTTGVGTTTTTTGNGTDINPVVIVSDSCTFTACVNVCTPYTIVGYDWTLSSGGTVTVHHTSAHTDCFTFTIPHGTSVTVSVVAHIIDFNYADGTSPCCEADLSQKVSCGEVNTPPCVDPVKSTLTWFGTSAIGGGCYFSCTANVVPLPGWTITGYQWSENGGPFVAGGPLHTTMTIPPGTSVTVTVHVTLVDQNGNICTYDMTVVCNCPNDPPPCIDPANSTLTWFGTSAIGGGCYFTCTAAVTPMPGWSITGYQWSENGGPFVAGGTVHTTVTIPGGTSITVTVRVTLVDQRGNVCTYDMTVVCNCPGDAGGGGSSAPVHPSGTSTDKITGANEISIFPNPTNDAVTVSSTSTPISSIQVIDVNGKKVGNFSYQNTKSANISLSKLPPGSYLFRVNNTTSKVVTKAE